MYRDARRGRNDPRECFEQQTDARRKCGAPSCEQPTRRTRHANMSLAVAKATTPLRYTTPTPPAHPRLSCSRFRGAPGAYGAAPPASRVLRIANATDLRPALAPGASTTPGAATTGRPTTCPADTGAPRKREHDSLTIRGPLAPTSRSRANTCPKTGQTNRKNHNTRPENGHQMSSGLDRPFHMNRAEAGDPWGVSRPSAGAGVDHQDGTEFWLVM